MADNEIHDPLLQQLRDERLLTSQQVEDITDEHERTGKPVRQLLMDLGLLNEEQILGVIHIANQRKNVSQQLPLMAGR